ncbi:hypothetical protein PQR65_05255 [Paraburkholderia nemoris]|uniref:hypothetical protein n=1 Tax=Paraburkholderia nemoris TaxID=2793076 RepID=UPI0038BBD9DE
MASAAATRTPSAGPSSSSGIERAIAAERARAAEIVAAGFSAGCVKQACSLAFDTNLSAKEAIAALNAGALDAAAQTGNGRRQRMGLDPADPTGSTSHRAPSAEEVAAKIVAAGEKAAGRSASSTASNPVAHRILAAGERARGQ